ncbi:MAG: hypothetical protein JNK64_03775 [Myxococcales bacterium]|nr:hypothetical protein [Myxococcales bacterium]
MKLALALVSCLSLALVGCEKKKSDAPAKPAPAAPAPGSAAAPTPTPGSAAPTPTPGSAAPTPGSTAVAPADGITLPNTPRQVGDKVTETEERTMVAKAEVGPGQVIDFNSTEKRVEAKEALAVVDGAITKLKVTYTTFTIDETVGGKPKAKPTPTAGKTYVVWREGGELKVTYEDGSAPPADEIKAVSKSNRSVGKPDVLDKFLAGQVWKTGVKVDLPADVLAEMNQAKGGDVEPSLTAMSFTLQTADDAVATMAMTMTMAGKSPTGEMGIELAGTAKVDRKTGRPVEVAATGPFTANVKVKMTGTMTMKTSYAF